MMRMGQAIWLACALSVLAGAGSAAAQGSGMTNENMALDDQIARAHFEAGKGHYRAGRFNEAADEFMKAYALSKRPDLLYNAYVAYRDAGQDEPAAKALRQYLEEKTDAPDRVNLEARLKTLEERVQQRKDEDAKIAAATAAANPAPVVAEPAAEPVVAPAAERSDGPGIYPWILVGLGGAAMVTGVLTGVSAGSKYGDIEDACPGNRCPADFDLQGKRDSVDTLATVTNVLLIGGAVVVGGGLLWYFLADKGDEGGAPTAASNVSLGGGCTSDGCLGAVKVGF